jgi:hypothetical protein
MKLRLRIEEEDCVSVLVMLRRKTGLVEALHGRRPWPDLSSMDGHGELAREGKGRREERRRGWVAQCSAPFFYVCATPCGDWGGGGGMERRKGGAAWVARYSTPFFYVRATPWVRRMVKEEREREREREKRKIYFSYLENFGEKNKR